MEQPTITKKTNTDFFQEGNLSESEQIAEWRGSLVQSTLEHLQMKYGNTDFILRDSKTLDNILNASRVKKRSIEEIIKEWRETTEEELINTTGTEFIFTKISKDVESTFVNRDPLKRMYKKSTVASLFHNGIKHGFCHCTSFIGDIVSNSSEILDRPEIINKTYALEKDKFEYE